MRILLTGRDGQVGGELLRTLAPLGEVIATSRTSLDLADLAALQRTVRDLKPDLIVNAAAYTAVDRAEAEPGLAMRVNGKAPGVLAEEAKRLGALLVHYSTDYVFDGEKSTPYGETDTPNPINAYGRTKLAGEQAVTESGARHLLLRISWVYAPRGRNFFLTIATRAAKGEPLRVVDDQAGTPTEARFVAEATARALAGTEPLQGLHHLSPAGQTSWCGFARAIVAQLGAATEVVPIRTSEYPAAARRPRYSVLRAGELFRAAGIERPQWQALLARCVGTYTGKDGARAAR